MHCKPVTAIAPPLQPFDGHPATGTARAATGSPNLRLSLRHTLAHLIQLWEHLSHGLRPRRQGCPPSSLIHSCLWVTRRPSSPTLRLTPNVPDSTHTSSNLPNTTRETRVARFAVESQPLPVTLLRAASHRFYTATQPCHHATLPHTHPHYSPTLRITYSHSFSHH